MSFLTSEHKHYDIPITFFPGASDVWFSLNGTTYQNNSCVTLEDIGENDTALLCRTNLTACCRSPYTGENGHSLGNLYFPNGIEVPSKGSGGDIYRTRGQMVVSMYRRRGGVAGIYRCDIPDSMNVNQSIYIGVYTAGTGEWYSYSIVTLTVLMLQKSAKYKVKYHTKHHG